MQVYNGHKMVEVINKTNNGLNSQELEPMSKVHCKTNLTK